MQQVVDEIMGAKAVMADGDFIGDDGLLHCGKCGGAKETLQQMPETMRARFGDTRKLPILCDCERERLAEMEAEAESQKREAEVSKARRACFPYESMWTMDFEHDDGGDAETSRICRKYAEEFERFAEVSGGLLFYGAVGTGKTFHAATIANALLDKGKKVLFTSLSTLGNRMSATFSGKQEVLADVCRYDAVVLDDLGIERSTPAMSENVYQIVNCLYQSGTVVIATTNMEPKEMAANQDPDKQRIYSRIFEMCRPVAVHGSDRRRGKSREKAGIYRDLLGV